AALEDDANPFESAQLVLCSLDFLVARPERRQQAVAAGWDLLVVDEAHHLRWSPEQVSPQYQCIEGLAEQVPGLLLLTATPEQLAVGAHFARLTLLDPARYHDLASFRAEEVGYQQVRVLVEKLLADNALDQLRDSDTLFAELESYLGAEAAATLRQTIATDLEHHDHQRDRKSTRLNSSHVKSSYAVFCLKKKT